MFNFVHLAVLQQICKLDVSYFLNNSVTVQEFDVSASDCRRKDLLSYEVDVISIYCITPV